MNLFGTGVIAIALTTCLLFFILGMLSAIKENPSVIFPHHHICFCVLCLTPYLSYHAISLSAVCSLLTIDNFTTFINLYQKTSLVITMLCEFNYINKK